MVGTFISLFCIRKFCDEKGCVMFPQLKVSQSQGASGDSVVNEQFSLSSTTSSPGPFTCTKH